MSEAIDSSQVIIVIGQEEFEAVVVNAIQDTTAEVVTVETEITFDPKDADRLAAALQAYPPTEHGMTIKGRNT